MTRMLDLDVCLDAPQTYRHGRHKRMGRIDEYPFRAALDARGRLL
jgi:hypothetical protein